MIRRRAVVVGLGAATTACGGRRPPPERDGTAAVHGVLTTREPVVLPPGSEVVLRIIDVASGASGVPLAEQRFASDRALPLPFQLSYDVSRHGAGSGPLLTAQVILDGRVLLEEAASRPLDPEAPFTFVDVLLRRPDAD